MHTAKFCACALRQYLFLFFAGGNGSMSHGGSGGNKRALPNSAIGSSKRQNMSIFPPHGMSKTIWLSCILDLCCNSQVAFAHCLKGHA